MIAAGITAQRSRPATPLLRPARADDARCPGVPAMQAFPETRAALDAATVGAPRRADRRGVVPQATRGLPGAQRAAAGRRAVADEQGLRNVFAALQPPGLDEGFVRVVEVGADGT